MTLAPREASQRTREICRMGPIMPVIVIKDAAFARPLGEALVSGGLPALEITLRTPAALDAIRAMSDIPGAVVGAGTLVTPDDVRSAKLAGAQFGVSPGATDDLLAACEEADLPLLPGAATATEAMRLFARGYEMLKFFPAEASGGVAALKAIGAPLPQIGFCPTGGINVQNAASYLALDNVLCAGGSWLAPGDLVETEQWAKVQALAEEARILGRPGSAA